MTIHDLIIKVQQNLSVPKSQYNTFGKYHYRSCEDILSAVKKALGKDGYITISDKIIEIAGRHYIEATATLTSRDGKESISSTAYAREPEQKKGMDEAQVTGATSSYARKYALNGLFGIDDTKDADTQDNRESYKEEQNKEAPKPKQSTSALPVCPECGQNSIIKGKKEYGGGYVCFSKKGGCGAKFKALEDLTPAKSLQESIDEQLDTVGKTDFDSLISMKIEQEKELLGENHKFYTEDSIKYDVVCYLDVLRNNNMYSNEEIKGRAEKNIQGFWNKFIDWRWNEGKITSDEKKLRNPSNPPYRPQEPLTGPTEKAVLGKDE